MTSFVMERRDVDVVPCAKYVGIYKYMCIYIYIYKYIKYNGFKPETTNSIPQRNKPPNPITKHSNFTIITI
jgi:hypothetical protein